MSTYSALAELGDLDHFLTARWVMFSPGTPALHHARAFHEPWPLQRARLVRRYDELVSPAAWRCRTRNRSRTMPPRSKSHRLALPGAVLTKSRNSVP